MVEASGELLASAFFPLSSEAFKPRSQWTLVQLFEHLRTGAGYECEALETAIHQAFSRQSRQPFFGMTATGKPSNSQQGGISWSLLGHLRTLKNRLLKNMDSERTWTDKFASLARQHPARYVRLNPPVAGKLPDLDDVQAIESGRLGQIATRYLQDPDTKRRIDSVSSSLISTCFYFQPTRTLFESQPDRLFVIEGEFFKTTGILVAVNRACL